MDRFSQPPVKKAEPEFYKNRNSQNDDGQPTEGDVAGGQDLADGGFQKIHTDDQHDNRHRETGKIFVAGVAVGVLRVGGLCRSLKPKRLMIPEEASVRLFKASAVMDTLPVIVPASSLKAKSSTFKIMPTEPASFP